MFVVKLIFYIFALTFKFLHLLCNRVDSKHFWTRKIIDLIISGTVRSTTVIKAGKVYVVWLYLLVKTVNAPTP